MNNLNSEITFQRIGEIVVISPRDIEKQNFIQSLCPITYLNHHDLLVGQKDINSSLALYFYGIGYQQNKLNFEWELLAKKILGYIILFQWYDEKIFAEVLEIINFLTEKFSTPVLIAADVKDNPYPVSENIFRPAISISKQSKFVFFKSGNAKSVNKVLITLVDTLIANIE